MFILVTFNFWPAVIFGVTEKLSLFWRDPKQSAYENAIRKNEKKRCKIYYVIKFHLWMVRTIVSEVHWFARMGHLHKKRANTNIQHWASSYFIHKLLTAKFIYCRHFSNGIDDHGDDDDGDDDLFWMKAWNSSSSSLCILQLLMDFGEGIMTDLAGASRMKSINL